MTSESKEEANTNEKDINEIVTEQNIEAYMGYCTNCKTDKHIFQDTKEGRLVCENCGNVVCDQLIAEGSEWRTFADDGTKSSHTDPNRVGGPENSLSTETLGLGTTVGADTKDLSDSSFSSLARSHASGQMTRSQKAFLQASMKASNLGSKLGVTRDATNLCLEIFKRVDEAKACYRVPLETVITGCMFYACKLTHQPVPIRDFFATTNSIRKRDLTKCIRVIKRDKLHLSDPKAKKVDTQTNPKDFLERFAAMLDPPLSVRVQTIASDILEKSDKLNMGARHPQTLAAAALYLAVQFSPQEKAPIDQLATASLMATSTIFSTYKIFYENRAFLVSSTYANESLLANLRMASSSAPSSSSSLMFASSSSLSSLSASSSSSLSSSSSSDVKPSF
eukprot:TRINITY_DN3383_c0_g1_i1.p1 TRINITY_DN3383_c0_g1~~TRINITY_DN3383_c0_g1_i1.p1  ORF type:complete len:393 (+),score=102.88 TRINITY_DN3383_c0_g1_i1:45-1223(+)